MLEGIQWLFEAILLGGLKKKYGSWCYGMIATHEANKILGRKINGPWPKSG